jgi:F-type H+-transporting ATPase subunit alpha
LKQSDLDPMPVEKQVCVFYAVLNNYFEPVAVENIQKTQNDLVEYLGKLHEEDILKPIRETGLFDDAVEAKLKEAITRFLEK